MKMHVKKNDKVIVISGEDAGKIGKVMSAYPKEGRVMVEGVNQVKKHVKPRNTQQQGGIITKEAPIAAAKVMLYCDKCGKGVRIGKQVSTDKDGKIKKVRVCKKCGAVLD